MVKIGDKVRFLNDVGGGTITGFQGKDIVLVADEDGFEIPTLVTEVVAVETNDYNIAKVVDGKKKGKTNEDKPTPTSVKNALAVNDDEEEEEETDIADQELTYKPMAQERRGANELNLCLAFVPKRVKEISDTPFEVYLVNDCNYYIHYTLLNYEGKACQVRHEGEIAPNTKVYLEELLHNRLEEWERITIQTLAFKRDKVFFPKPTYSVNLRFDGTKFYKLHAFQPSVFFNTPALTYDILKDDRAVRPMFVDADELREAMQTPEEQLPTEPQPRISGAEKRATRKQDRNAIVEVDLHAHELLDTMVGLEPRDILEYQIKVFRDTMNAHLKKHGCHIVFIHGKGEGVLRNALLKELRTHYKQCRVQDASFREYGYGATMVTI
jgi:hypothetical protein